MFGRVRRQSCSSPDSLECQSTPKLIKSDSLSIYEATLIKLKQGSRRNLPPLSELPVKLGNDSAADLPDDEVVSMDSDSSVITHQSTDRSMDRQLGGNQSKSILCFFSRRMDLGSYLSSSSLCEAAVRDDSSESGSVGSGEIPSFRGMKDCQFELESCVGRRELEWRTS